MKSVYLHCIIYIPCINKVLEEFSNDWRYHSLSSEKNQSPYQLWHYGMTRCIHLDIASAEIAGITDWSDYGIDEEPAFPKIDTLNNVEIPESRVFLCVFHVEQQSFSVSPTCSRWQRRY